MSRLWAVTSYFNPLDWKSRLRNYRAFRRWLKVPLLTVEWHPAGDFSLTPDDADLLVQLSGGDLMWQKERLLNIGFSRLPSEVEFVAWLDCDIFYSQADVSDEIIESLEKNPVIQLFSEVHYVDREMTEAAVSSTLPPSEAKLRSDEPKLSSARDWAERGKASFVQSHVGAPGMAWAARRDLMTEVGLFDRCIMGSGDFFWLLGAVGLSQSWLHRRADLGLYNYIARSSYYAWAHRIFEKVQGRVGYLDRALFHLNHGELANRKYFERHARFGELGIDCDADIESTAQGVWKFRKPQPEWGATMEDYFLGRREDDR